MTSEEAGLLRDAWERTVNMEPFTKAELEALKALPGVTVDIGWTVRKGVILRCLTHVPLA